MAKEDNQLAEAIELYEKVKKKLNKKFNKIRLPNILWKMEIQKKHQKI